MQLQLQLHYITQHDTTLITLHYTTTATTTTLHYTTLQLQLHYFTLQYTRLHYTTPRYSTQHSRLQYTTLITPHHNYNCNYTTLITLHYNYNLKLQFHYATTTTTPTITTTTALHHTTSSSCGEVTTATIAATPENTTPTTFRSISGFALPSVIHNNTPHRLVRYWYLTTHCMCTLLLLLLYRYGWQTKSRTTNGVQSCFFSLSMADLRYPPFFFGDSRVWTTLFQGLPTKSIKIHRNLSKSHKPIGSYLPILILGHISIYFI